MQIAVMMRVMDQDTGLRFYTEALVEDLLRIHSENSYLLLYMTPKWFGRFAGFSNAREVLIPASNKVLWDQVLVPYRAWREKADLIFNPKFTVPLISHCPVAMGLQEPAWWAHPEHHTWLDVRYMRTMLPLYCRKAVHFFPWTKFVLDENRKYLGLPLDNSTITYTACNGHFGRVKDTAALKEFRDKYQLPDKYILSVTRVENLGNRSASFSDTKNPEATVKAYNQIRDQIPHKMVILGRRVREYFAYRGWKDSELDGVYFPGFIEHDDLPMLYSSAELFVIPSFYEGFAITLMEAMTCGCPVVASQAGACPEVGGEAVLLADPYDPSDFAAKMIQVLKDEDLKRELQSKSLERAKFFTREKTARLTLDGLNKAAKVNHAVRVGL